MYVQTLHLRKNMGIPLGRKNADFPLKLLSIRNGIAPNNDGYIFTVGNSVAAILCTIDNLFSKIYLQLDSLLQKPWLCKRSITS